MATTSDQVPYVRYSAGGDYGQYIDGAAQGVEGDGEGSLFRLHLMGNVVCNVLLKIRTCN